MLTGDVRIRAGETIAVDGETFLVVNVTDDGDCGTLVGSDGRTEMYEKIGAGNRAPERRSNGNASVCGSRRR